MKDQSILIFRVLISFSPSDGSIRNINILDNSPDLQFSWRLQCLSISMPGQHDSRLVNFRGPMAVQCLVNRTRKGFLTWRGMLMRIVLCEIVKGVSRNAPSWLMEITLRA